MRAGLIGAPASVLAARGHREGFAGSAWEDVRRQALRAGIGVGLDGTDVEAVLCPSHEESTPQVVAMRDGSTRRVMVHRVVYGDGAVRGTSLVRRGATLDDTRARALQQTWRRALVGVVSGVEEISIDVDPRMLGTHDLAMEGVAPAPSAAQEVDGLVAATMRRLQQGSIAPDRARVAVQGLGGMAQALVRGLVAVGIGASSGVTRDLCRLPLDVLLLAGGDRALTHEHADAVRARAVVEAASGAVSSVAEVALAYRGIPVVPDLVARAGAFATSTEG
ncbi:MAG TPA: hypothetical protein DHW40_07180, partial [Microbacterium sp.]|nr:hypothetical protein [Microbacterium sp.]